MQGQAKQAARLAWRWSFGGLPDWLTSPGLVQRWSHVLHIENLPEDLDNFGGFAKSRRINVVLSRELCLKKELRLPAAARNTLARVVDLNIRQSSPNGASNLVWQHKVRSKQRESIVVDVFLVKKQILENIRNRAIENKVILRKIKLADPSVEPFFDNRSRADRPRKAWDFASLICLFGLVAYLAVGELRETRALQSKLAELKDTTSRLSDEAMSKRTALDTENETFASIAHDIDMFRAEFRRLPFILNLTEGLPDTAWISEYSLNGNTQHISGFAEGDVTDVMETIRSLPDVSRVDLNGQISFDSFTRRNRFNLAIELIPSQEVRQ